MNNLRRTLLSSSGGGIDPTTGRGTIGDYEVVDLGLPSGLLWATCNVGATKETGYGDYYWYGAGSQKFTYPSNPYSGNENPLPSSADTATQVMGKGWRMPTQTELQELINNTNYEFIENFNGSGINGVKFISKSNPNAYVFFPASGEYNSNTGKLQSDGESGSIWSSTPGNNYNAIVLSSSIYRVFVTTYSRSFGFNVRGVYREPGKPMPPMSVLFVNKNDTTQKEIFKEEDWPSASDWTPIGIVVVPSSHNRYGDGTNGIMSLGCLNTDGTMQTDGTADSSIMSWGGYRTDTSLSNYTTCDGSNSYGFVQYQTNNSSTALSYASTPNITYPYTDLTATEHNVISVGSLSDYDGVGNTNILNDSSHSPAAACKKFKTSGTSAGDWYLPAVGELAYLPSIRYQVNDTISALNTKYGNVGVQLNINGSYQSSSEYNDNRAWLLRKNGYVVHDDKIYGYHVRAFLRF